MQTLCPVMMQLGPWQRRSPEKSKKSAASAGHARRLVAHLEKAAPKVRNSYFAILDIEISTMPLLRCGTPRREAEGEASTVSRFSGEEGPSNALPSPLGFAVRWRHA
jgi:hypothetical protein